MFDFRLLRRNQLLRHQQYGSLANAGINLLFLVVALIVGASFFILSLQAVQAQEDIAPAVKATVPLPAAVTTTESLAGNINAVDESNASLLGIIEDFGVSSEDLGANEANVLPDSFWHGFKRFGWGLQETFTFDPVKKAETQLGHANQQLWEVKQLIDEQGIENVDKDVLGEAIDYYENKLDQVRDAAAVISEKHGEDPDLVEGLLDELTDKHLAQQKLLDGISEEVADILEEKKAAGENTDSNLENVMALVEDTKDGVLTAFTETLLGVEEPAEVATRLDTAFDRQEGSAFKELPNLEFLEAFSSKVPETVQQALEAAKQNALERFETSLQGLPPVVRAQQFEDYVQDAVVDETRLMMLLEDIKQSAGIPQDILSKIEEAKEIAVRRFEDKLKLFEDKDLEERFFRGFGDDVGSLVALTEFKNRMQGGTEEVALMEDLHAQQLDAFKAQFSDADSSAQAERFATLSRAMLENPTPKTFELLRVLEDEVHSDPTKSAFLDQIGENMKRQFEGRFRQEGPRYMDQLVSLDPNDMAILGEFDFDPAFIDEFAARNAAHFTDYMQTVQVPDEFDQFHERFFDVPQFVFDEIRANDTGFQDVIQFKARKMQELRLEQERDLARAKLDFEEREVRHQLDRVQRQREDDFWNNLNQVPWDDFETRKALWDQKIDEDFNFVEERFTEQQSLFEQRLALDPWCDELCQEIQRLTFEQELRHEKERLADDLVRERNRLEIEQVQFERDNPLVNVCDTPESCEDYCRVNQGVPGCEWAMHTGQECPGGYFDFGLKDCVYDFPGSGPDYVECGPGEFFDGFGCQADPYYQASVNFQACPWGMHWNDFFGFCEPDFTGPYPPGPGGPGPFPPGQFPPDGPPNVVLPVEPPPGGCGDGSYFDPYYGCTSAQCPPGMFFDGALNNCVPSCGQGEFFDNYAGRCVSEIQCEPGFFPDHFSGECLRECGPGEYLDFYDKTCKPDNWQGCPFGEFWNPEINSCEREFCPFDLGPIRICDTGEQPVPPDPYDLCGQPSCVPDSSQCPFDISVAFPAPCPDDQYREIITDAQGCQSFGQCIPSGTQPPLPPEPEVCPDVYNPVCGTDNITYDNDCRARQAGVGVSYYGSCPTAPYVNECPSGQYYAYELDRCLNDRDYVPGAPEKCESGWIWQGDYCAVDTSVIPECATYCEPACGGNTYCEFNQFGCAVGCVEAGAETCGNNYCGPGEDASICPSDCGETDYPGDENSCPGFAYSRWDSAGVRYCQLNSETKCDYNYPSYLTNDSSYAAQNCPASDTVTTGYCGDNVCDANESSTSCASDCGPATITCPATAYNAYGTDSACDPGYCGSGCNYDASGCPVGCYDPDYVCPTTEATTPGNRSQCNASACSNGCNYDYNGCPSSCITDTNVTYCGIGWSWDTQTNSCIKDGVTCNDPGACSACSPGSQTSSGSAGQWCNYNDSGCPLGCQGSASSGCNYNNICDPDENSGSCSDCYSSAGYCGDNICNNGETSSSCPGDCNGGAVCPSTVFNNYTTTGACNYSNCPNGCNFDSIGCPVSCYDSSVASSCGDGNCDGTESSSGSCPADCGSVSLCNYNNVCDAGESVGSCSDCGGGTSCPATQYNYYTSGYTCDPAVCPTGCNYDAQGCPAGCSASGTTGSCGDNICNNGETAASCASDCGGTTGSCPSSVYNDNTTGYTCSYTQCPNGCSWDSSGCAVGCVAASCGNGTCDSGEDQYSCPTDCYTGSTGGTCGNGYCDSGEDQYLCPADCYSGASGDCNYNNFCDTWETSASCSDCSGSSAGTASCPANAYNDNTGGYNCSYTQCPNGCVWDSSGCATGCNDVSGYCGNNICDPGEDLNNCASDCGGGTEPPQPGPAGYCGDGICQPDMFEDSSSCASDCGAVQGASTYQPPKDNKLSTGQASKLDYNPLRIFGAVFDLIF